MSRHVHTDQKTDGKEHLTMLEQLINPLPSNDSTSINDDEKQTAATANNSSDDADDEEVSSSSTSTMNNVATYGARPPYWSNRSPFRSRTRPPTRPPLLNNVATYGTHPGQAYYNKVTGNTDEEDEKELMNKLAPLSDDKRNFIRSIIDKDNNTRGRYDKFTTDEEHEEQMVIIQYGRGSQYDKATNRYFNPKLPNLYLHFGADRNKHLYGFDPNKQHPFHPFGGLINPPPSQQGIYVQEAYVALCKGESPTLHPDGTSRVDNHGKPLYFFKLEGFKHDPCNDMKQFEKYMSTLVNFPVSDLVPRMWNSLQKLQEKIIIVKQEAAKVQDLQEKLLKSDETVRRAQETARQAQEDARIKDAQLQLQKQRADEAMQLVHTLLEVFTEQSNKQRAAEEKHKADLLAVINNQRVSDDKHKADLIGVIENIRVDNRDREEKVREDNRDREEKQREEYRERETKLFAHLAPRPVLQPAPLAAVPQDTANTQFGVFANEMKETLETYVDQMNQTRNTFVEQNDKQRDALVTVIKNQLVNLLDYFVKQSDNQRQDNLDREEKVRQDNRDRLTKLLSHLAPVAVRQPVLPPAPLAAVPQDTAVQVPQGLAAAAPRGVVGDPVRITAGKHKNKAGIIKTVADKTYSVNLVDEHGVETGGKARPNHNQVDDL